MMHRLLRRVLLFTIPVAVTAVPGAVSANHLCGFVVVNPGVYVMPHDHTCPAGTAFTVQASDVTIDLNGFALIGQDTGDVGIDVEPGVDNVRITNGFIRGFDTGIDMGDCAGLVTTPDMVDLVVDGVTVRNSGTSGIRMCGAVGDPLITNTAVIGAGLQGIEVRGEGSVVSSVIRDTGTGVILQPDTDSSEPATIRGSLVEDTTGAGVLATGAGSGVGAGRVDIVDTVIQGTVRGVQTMGDVHPLISGTTISDTTHEGIWIRRSTTPGFERPFAIENTIVAGVAGGVADAGIVISDRPGGGSIVSTAVRDVAGSNGIMLACFTTFVTIDDVRVRGVDGDGLQISDATAVHGESCHNGSVPGGISVTGSVFRGSGASGAAVLAGDAHLFAGNLFRANAVDGLFIDGDVGQTSPLLQNTARANGDDGFQLDTADLDLTANVARNNDGWGFETNFEGPVAVDNGQTAGNNTLGSCSDPDDLPNTTCEVP